MVLRISCLAALALCVLGLALAHPPAPSGTERAVDVPDHVPDSAQPHVHTYDEPADSKLAAILTPAEAEARAKRSPTPTYYKKGYGGYGGYGGGGYGGYGGGGGGCCNACGQCGGGGGGYPYGGHGGGGGGGNSYSQSSSQASSQSSSSSGGYGKK